MQGVNAQVVAAVSAWLAQGEAVWLATITKTWGASPRPAGSLFAYCARRDEVAGSISGGCIEEDLLQTLATKSYLGQPETIHYGGSAEEQARFQLPCGGQLALILEQLSGSRAAQHFAEVLQRLAQRNSVIRNVCLASGKASLEYAQVGDQLLSCTSSTMRLRLGPGERVLIIGSGEVSAYLAELVESLDFSVTVCEPRLEHFQRFQRQHPRLDLRHCLPDDLIVSDFNDPFTAIIALSHDPRVDDMGLIAALQSKAFLVGAMGSERTSEARRERLKALGLGSHALSRLQAPVGMDVPSKTPPEIAIAVAAQLITARAQLYASQQRAQRLESV